MSGHIASNKNISSPHPSWAGRSHVTIFVRCLHLLDLDLLEDWPGVTEQLFTAKVAQQNLQQRVKAVEWCLYRLFELYDPIETKDKLRPFFPPTTQLQSLNLRAALYRCLTELKRIGELSKDVLLRKTMLDECKGERFEEVIASFAMSTLRRTAALATGVQKNVIPDGHLLPIILAYRVSLQHNLNVRKQEDTRVSLDLDQLTTASAIIQQRLDNCHSTPVVLNKDKQEQLRSLVNTHWIGNVTWSGILLQGIPAEGVVGVEASSERPVLTSQPQVLIRSLDSRIEVHRRRLAEWKVTAKDSKAKQKPLADLRPLPEPKDTSELLRFVKHKNLNLIDRKAASATELDMDESYTNLLTSLRRGFEAHPATIKRSSQKPSIAHLSPVPKVSQHTMTNTTVVLETSNQQQLIAERSSPVSHSVASGNDGDLILPDKDKQLSMSSSSPQSSLGDSPWVPSPQFTPFAVEGNQSTPVRTSTPSMDVETEPPVSPSKLWMSLADRTRASMSLTGRTSMLTDPESPVSNETQQPKISISQDQMSDDDRYATLAERTRKSMSMFSNSSAIRRRKADPHKRNSQAFPINQFETPGRPQQPVECTDDSGVSTPQGNLFNEEAEYTSIFKSRPKLALSPAFSPERQASGLDDILEQDMERLTLDSDNNLG